jgi:hypothetical protein
MSEAVASRSNQHEIRRAQLLKDLAASIMLPTGERPVMRQLRLLACCSVAHC